MLSPGIEKELHRHLDLLPASRQRQVLDFAKKLSTMQLRGVPGSSLIAFAGSFPTEDLAQMQAAIEADCALADVRGW